MWRIELLIGAKKGILSCIDEYDEKIRVEKDAKLRRKYYKKIFDSYDLLDWIDEQIDKIAYNKRDDLEKIINLLKK